MCGILNPLPRDYATPNHKYTNECIENTDMKWTDRHRNTHVLLCQIDAPEWIPLITCGYNKHWKIYTYEHTTTKTTTADDHWLLNFNKNAIKKNLNNKKQEEEDEEKWKEEISPQYKLPLQMFHQHEPFIYPVYGRRLPSPKPPAHVYIVCVCFTIAAASKRSKTDWLTE